MATHHLATWSHNLALPSLPPAVQHAALRTLYNWAGCAIAGSTHPATLTAHRALSPFFGAPTSSLLGHRGAAKTDAQHAALLNGIASHVHDYDDTHLDTIVHPAGPVASALLAAAEWIGGVSGRNLLLALVVGVEVECKLALAVWPEHYDAGWHITSTAGAIGAAAAVAKLLGLSVSQTQHAIGVAATQVTGLREMFGGMTKALHVGRAAQSGLLAAVLAREGYTSSETALEAKRGWAHVVGMGKEGVEGSLERWLGMGETNEVGLAGKREGDGRWEILRNSFKPFPCGIVVHPVIDGCAQLKKDMRDRGLDVRGVTSVHAKVHPLVLELTGKRFPKDGLEAKFSVFHGAAIGLIYGRGTPKEYEDAVVQHTDVIETRDKVRAEADSCLKADEAEIVVTMQDGDVLEKHVEHAVGSLEVPMSDEMLQQKFEDQCLPVLGDDTKAASKACWNIGNVDDIVQLTKLL